MKPFIGVFISFSQGAFTSVHVATSSDLDGVGGKYFANCDFCRVSPLSKDRKLAERLWKESEILTGLAPATASD